MIRLLRGALLVLVFLAAGAGFCFAQETPAQPAKLSQDFASLRTHRTKLLAEIPRLQQELRELQSRREDLAFLKREHYEARRDLAAAQREPSPNPDKIQALQEQIANLEHKLQEYADIEGRIKQVRDAIPQRQQELSALEIVITDLLNPEIAKQTFKRHVSLVFAALVAMVILGFFWIAINNETVSRAIFSGEAGMQFVTLFSVVIAIILFGVTDILEGKELAALLGGLSGYILGRVTAERQTPPPAATPAPSPSTPPALPQPALPAPQP